jgi:hypothetical protein
MTKSWDLATETGDLNLELAYVKAELWFRWRIDATMIAKITSC